jgi:hypothetical protein
VKFIAYLVGRVAQITIDGIPTAQVNTFQENVKTPLCRIVEWSSGTIPAGQHTILVTALDFYNATGNGYVLDILGFVYVVITLFKSSAAKRPTGTLRIAPPLSATSLHRQPQAVVRPLTRLTR